MDKQFSQEILAQIEAKKITPLPRWRFDLSRATFWTITSISLIIAGVAVGAALFILLDFRQHSLGEIPHDLVEILLMVPLVWILALAIFVFITNYSFKHTSRGYRYQLWTIVAGSLLISLGLGIALELCGIGEVTHEWLEEQVPIYHAVTYDSREAWISPVSGRLAGVVAVINNRHNFSLIDFHGRVWQVQSASSSPFIPVASSTILMSGLYDASSSSFVAQCVHDWQETVVERDCP